MATMEAIRPKKLFQCMKWAKHYWLRNYDIRQRLNVQQFHQIATGQFIGSKQQP